MSSYLKYEVYFQPRISDRAYGDEIDVTESIDASGISTIRESVDSDDYNYGVFKFGDVRLRGLNNQGLFNEPSDSRSIFTFDRDKTRVRIVFVQVDRETDQEVSTVQFKGLLAEEATRLDIERDIITFRVLNLLSGINKATVPNERVATGQTVSQAIFQILNVPEINTVVTVDQANISVPNDVEVDVGGAFSGVKTKDALEELLLIGNAVIIVNENDEIVVKDREFNLTRPVINLFGPFTESGQSNVLKVSNYNTGLHRLFPFVRINNQTADLRQYTEAYGSRPKTIELDWLTNATKLADSALELADQFKTPKLECEIEIPTQDAVSIRLQDPISIDYPLRTRPPEGKDLPVIGLTEIGDDQEPLPLVFGSNFIPPQIRFQVMEIAHNVRSFTSRLKLRQTGVDLTDGQFNEEGNNLVGFAVIGVAVLGGPGDTCATFNPSVAGAAKIGCTLAA